MAPRVESTQPNIQAKAIERCTEMPMDMATWWSSATAVMVRPARVLLKNQDKPRPIRMVMMPPYSIDEAQLRLLATATSEAIEEATACA